MIAKTISTVAASAVLIATYQPAHAQSATNNLRDFFEAREIPVNVDNFVRAASNIEFGKYVALAGGVNRFFHVSEPTSIERQPTIRMNRDTLYSMAVIDITQGATLTLPDTGDRYISAQIVNQDHYMNKVFLGGGVFTLDKDTFDTDYVVVIIRTLVDAANPADLAAVHELQSQITLEAGSSRPFLVPNHDQDDFENVLEAALQLARFTPDSSRTFGAKDTVDPVRYFLGAAFGWGGLPEEEAFYLNVEPGLPVGAYKIEVPADVRRCVLVDQCL